jgi:glycosyltransferase involved in cell wall biosynthesis
MGVSSPPVSILLPVLDAESTIEACLKSIRRQTFRDWECLVVDDGSTDATPELVQGLAARDGRFRLLPGPHRGLVSALNRGLGHCRGRYVARMDADDLMHRQRLADQTALLSRRADWAAVGCHVRVFPRAAMTDGTRSYERWLNAIDSPEGLRREAFVECPVAHPTLMLRRELVPVAGYRDQGWPEDYDLVLRLLTAGKEIGVLGRRRLCWRDRPERLWRTGEAYGRERITRCKATFLARSFLAGEDRYGLWGYGGTAKAIRRALGELGKQPCHIVELHPGRLGNRIHGADVIAPSRLRESCRRPLLVSVAGAGPRNEIRGALESMGLRELRDFVCVA